MDEQDRAEILAEILEERLPTVQRVIEEWSVPGAEAVNYAQLKDLIWEIMAPLGLTVIGFSAAERARQASPADPDLLSARDLFAHVGADIGRLLDRFLETADAIRP